MTRTKSKKKHKMNIYIYIQKDEKPSKVEREEQMTFA